MISYMRSPGFHRWPLYYLWGPKVCAYRSLILYVMSSLFSLRCTQLAWSCPMPWIRQAHTRRWTRTWYRSLGTLIPLDYCVYKYIYISVVFAHKTRKTIYRSFWILIYCMFNYCLIFCRIPIDICIYMCAFVVWLRICILVA